MSAVLSLARLMENNNYLWENYRFNPIKKNHPIELKSVKKCNNYDKKLRVWGAPGRGVVNSLCVLKNPILSLNAVKLTKDRDREIARLTEVGS